MEVSVMSEPTATEESQHAERRAAPNDATPEPPASLLETADQAVKAVTALCVAADAALQRQVRRDPYVVLLTAAGAGLVVGASPVGRMLLRTVVRTLGPRLMTSLVDGALQGHSGATSAEEHSHSKETDT